MLTTDALQPQLTRDAMEAHLALQGWVPVSYGACGARKGEVIVYVYRRRKNPLDPAHNAEYELAAAYASAVVQDVPLNNWDVDSWFWSDPLFARLARAIFEHDRSDAA